MNSKIYIHEFIDIIGPNRARYMHHMTANWCPIAARGAQHALLRRVGDGRVDRRWPEVVNMWELDGWDGLAANFARAGHAVLQDPSLAEWWAAAAELRRSGFDRVVLPTVEPHHRASSRRGSQCGRPRPRTRTRTDGPCARSSKRSPSRGAHGRGRRRAVYRRVPRRDDERHRGHRDLGVAHRGRRGGTSSRRGTARRSRRGARGSPR